MSVSNPKDQSAVQRAVEAQVQALIARFAPAHVRLAESARQLLRKRLPTAHEIVYEYRSWFVISYSPNANGYDGVLALRGDADDVKLYFNRGKELPDPEKLLKGSGSLARAIALDDMSALPRPAVARLIDEAIARSPVPFAKSGYGPTIIRPAGSAKKRAASSRSKPAAGRGALARWAKAHPTAIDQGDGAVGQGQPASLLTSVNRHPCSPPLHAGEGDGRRYILQSCSTAGPNSWPTLVPPSCFCQKKFGAGRCRPPISLLFAVSNSRPFTIT